MDGLEQRKEECRNMRHLNFIDNLEQDLRFGLGMMHRSPGVNAAAVLSLALGIDANTAIFSLIDAVMLKMLPVKSPERLVLLNWVCLKRPAAMAVQSGYVDNSETGWRSPSFAYPSFEEFRAQNHAFASIFGFTPLSHATVNIDGQAGLGGGELVTGDYFSGLGVSPILGRTINDEDAKASSPRVAVISYGYWSRQFGSSPDVIGKHIAINLVPFTIVGVAPPA